MAVMTRLDAIRARLAANVHATYPELQEPWAADVAWLVELVDVLKEAAEPFAALVREMPKSTYPNHVPVSVRSSEVSALADALARLEEPDA